MADATPANRRSEPARSVPLAAASQEKAARTRPVHVHIENLSALADVFQITSERYDDVARQHSGVAEHTRATISYDFERFDECLRTAEVLIGWEFPTDNLAERAPNLRWIHVTGAGIEHLLPLDWLPRRVTITNNSGVHAEKAGEFAITAILMLNHGFAPMIRSQQRSRWEQEFRTPLRNKTLAILGVGQMGQAAARQAKRFGMRVIGVRRSGRPRRNVDVMYRSEDLDEVLRQADTLLITLPLTPETTGLVGQRELDLMKPDASVINMGRAGVMDYNALADKLERGELDGAILDVFDPEPLPSESRLWRTPNLILTPHCSSDDLEQYGPLTVDLVFQNLQRYIAGRPLLNRVSRKHAY